jgi:hypothetical protein
MAQPHAVQYVLQPAVGQQPLDHGADRRGRPVQRLGTFETFDLVERLHTGE